jgi:hypothetical protein
MVLFLMEMLIGNIAMKIVFMKKIVDFLLY